jgi:hypothetical protein
MEAVRSSETSVTTFKTACSENPEGYKRHRRRVNIQSQLVTAFDLRLYIFNFFRFLIHL